MHIYIVRVFVSDMALIKISQMGLHWMGGNVHANKAVLCIASGCALSVNLAPLPVPHCCLNQSLLCLWL